MKNKKYYFIIFMYGLILTLFLVAPRLYGSGGDWISQHVVIPQMFRSLFYETHKLIPNFVFNLGAGQNIFNYSYYGLMSPIILISYLFPFIKMSIFIMIISFLTYITTGFLTFKFVNSHGYSKKISLFMSLALISLTPLTYHFHHHIMFVWYYPFLILALMGVDKYVTDKKSTLLIISIFLLILTNYYYSVSSLIVIAIYGVYRLLDKDDFQIKTFIIDILKAIVKVIIPILMAMFILLPSLYSVINSGRIDSSTVKLSSLFLFNMKETIYQAFTTGISFIFLLALFINIICKNKKKSEVFLNIVLIIITFIPLFTYILNGFLYVRGKVLIPFSILYFVSFLTFFDHIKKKDISIKNILIISFFIGTFVVLTNFHANTILLFVLDVIVCSLSMYLFYRFKKDYIIFLPVIATLVICSFFYNNKEEYIPLKKYQKEYVEKVKTLDYLLNQIKDTDYFRTQNNDNYQKTANMYYRDNYYSTSIYSSNYNNYYWNFFNFEAGNHIQNRNAFVSAGTYNTLFHTFMGTRYIVSSSNDVGLNYKNIASKNNLYLHYNKNAYPLVYVTDKVGSLKQYKTLEFPYTLEYLLNYPVTKETEKIDYETYIHELDLDLEDKYEFTLTKKQKLTYNLKSPITNQFLIIRFDMDYNESCSNGDTYITINGEKNKLTCDSWYYHNKNNTFEYVLSSNYPIEKLNISISKGTYHLKNIHVYTMDNILPKFESINNLNINKKNSTVTGSINIKNDSYVITSFPYDKGFEVYVDNKKINKEIINTAFLGFKVEAGNHQIKIVYHSPLYKEGIILSFVGILGMIGIYMLEHKGVKKNGKN